MQDIIRRIHNLLQKNRMTIAVAESCTGGLLSRMLTELPGSSEYFLFGAITYSNQSKIKILDIPAQVIKRYGAVSGETAQLMAKNVSKLASSDFGIGITGIAGPTGATTAKPVGTVYIAIYSKKKQICRKFRFAGNRAAIRKKSALKALQLLSSGW